jgi:hypothetical protein
MEVVKSHEPNQQLAFKHPQLLGILVFSAEGELSFIDIHGRNMCPPLWLSDFDRNDWILIPNEE